MALITNHDDSDTGAVGPGALTLCGRVIGRPLTTVAALDQQVLVELRTVEMSGRCAGCQHRGGCQPWFLRRQTLRLRASNPLSATVGQQVRVVVAGPALLRGAVTGFLLPVVLMVAASVVSATLMQLAVPDISVGKRDLMVLVAALAGLAGGLFAYRVQLARRWTEMPCQITAIVAEATPHQRG